MNKFSAKNKIIILLIVWLAVSAMMLTYFFKILDISNAKTLTAMDDDRQSLALLEDEDQSFKAAQSDLQKLAQEPMQPADFFSSDITLVKELVILENMEQKYGVQMTLSGVAGTIDSLPPAPTASPIVVVPYNIDLVGSLVADVNFLEALENASFVTSIGGMSLGAAGNNTVNLDLSADFYLLKQN